jgi:hypothetical protein
LSSFQAQRGVHYQARDRGLANSAAANDTPGHLIQRQLRHKKFDTTVGYIQDAELLKKNAAAMVGL